MYGWHKSSRLPSIVYNHSHMAHTVGLLNQCQVQMARYVTLSRSEKVGGGAESFIHSVQKQLIHI